VRSFRLSTAASNCTRLSSQVLSKGDEDTKEPRYAEERITFALYEVRAARAY
jgi:hypothetical protein